jgi:anti-sigma B factor antagonist
MHQLNFERKSADNVELLEVTGEIDIASAARLMTGLNETVGDCDKPVVVDLSEVDFMDSTGLALLLNANRRLARRDKGFAIVCGGGPVRRVFEITDMVGTLNVHADRDAATNAALGEGSLSPD